MAINSNNILIGSPGIPGGESNNIRIGVQGTQTSCQIAGIYGAAIGAVNAGVMVSNDGKLGTTGSELGIFGSLSFFYYVATTVNNVTGSTAYWLGAGDGMTAHPLTSLYDNSGGAFVPGSGTANNATNAAYFEAPVDGIYFFQVAINANIGSPYNTVDSVAYVQINTPGPVNYSSQFTCTNTGPGFFLGNQLLLIAPAVKINATNRASFQFDVQRGDGRTVNGVTGSNNPYISYVCGYRVA